MPLIGRSAAAAAIIAASVARGDNACDGTGSCAAARPPQPDNVLLQVSKPKKNRGNCTFLVDPETPFYWDEECKIGKVGCWADSVHVECRFCSYDGVPCPADAWHPSKEKCTFDNQPAAPYYWEPQCPEIDGGRGCKADGVHDGCRYCGGEGDYRDIECKEERCDFDNEPMIPYYYDEDCAEGVLGCRADGVHLKCRYCGARPYDSIECPKSAAIPENACWFRNQPKIPYYWDADCKMGMKGCWADGIHQQCRFCSKKSLKHSGKTGNTGESGDGADSGMKKIPYEDIECPEEHTAPVMPDEDEDDDDNATETSE